MAVRDVPHRPPSDDAATHAVNGHADAQSPQEARYRPLPTGMHGLDPATVKRDQCERLQSALIELIAHKGYPAVRIVDLAKLAHVSPPTFYGLYSDKEDLLLNAYDEIAERTVRTVLKAYAESPKGQQLLRAMSAFAELAVVEPQPISLYVLGAFGAGSSMLERRTQTLKTFEDRIRQSRDGKPVRETVDFTVKFILGGIREVTTSRLRNGRESELPALAGELTSWAGFYPRRLPRELALTSAEPDPDDSEETDLQPSERARRAEGRLPSGRSDLPRQFIVKSQQERIVDATAAIVAEKGLAALTIPEIARRANVSYQTFYGIYPSKHDAFMGAQKVGMHQALRITVEAYDAHKDDWPRAVAASLSALINYLASEPAHAHLSVVDTFAASPETIEIRNASMDAFAAYLLQGQHLAPELRAVPSVTAEAVAGGVWQVLHHYIQSGRVQELPTVTPQLIYMALTPYVGTAEAVRASLAGDDQAAST
jgi:AcrR family transcriptional regulator